MTVRTRLAIGVVSIVVLSILVYAAMVIHTFPERHARSCLITVTELADRTIDEDIPKRRFHDAVAAAKYIKWHYPPGAVLPEDHPFAAEYQAGRETQIRRIREALQEATGNRHPTIWQRWKSEIEGNDPGASRYDGSGVGTMAYNSFTGIGKGGTGTLKVDGKVVATKKMEKTVPIILQWDESFDIGSDTITGVNDADYTPPFPLTAKFNKLTIDIDRPQLSPEEIKKLEEGLKKVEAGRE